MEALNSLIKEVDRHATLTPLPGRAIVHRHASFYADDLVVLLAPLESDIECLHQILQLFVGAYGLVTNVHKCIATPIQCLDDMVTIVQHVFPCVMMTFPCKYLGIPMSLMRLQRVDEQPLVDAIMTRIPTWKLGLLTNASRALLTKVTLSAIPFT
jgi:hypothetical protein